VWSPCCVARREEATEKQSGFAQLGTDRRDRLGRQKVENRKQKAESRKQKENGKLTADSLQLEEEKQEKDLT
jgi:hypothetical protein